MFDSTAIPKQFFISFHIFFVPQLQSETKFDTLLSQTKVANHSWLDKKEKELIQVARIKIRMKVGNSYYSIQSFFSWVKTTMECQQGQKSAVKQTHFVFVSLLNHSQNWLKQKLSFLFHSAVICLTVKQKLNVFVSLSFWLFGSETKTKCFCFVALVFWPFWHSIDNYQFDQ